MFFSVRYIVSTERCVADDAMINKIENFQRTIPADTWYWCLKRFVELQGIVQNVRWMPVKSFLLAKNWKTARRKLRWLQLSLTRVATGEKLVFVFLVTLFDFAIACFSSQIEYWVWWLLLVCLSVWALLILSNIRWLFFLLWEVICARLIINSAKVGNKLSCT